MMHAKGHAWFNTLMFKCISLLSSPTTHFWSKVSLSFAVHNNYQHWLRSQEAWFTLQCTLRVIRKIVVQHFFFFNFIMQNLVAVEAASKASMHPETMADQQYIDDTTGTNQLIDSANNSNTFRTKARTSSQLSQSSYTKVHVGELWNRI